jgi:hypothetical protein
MMSPAMPYIWFAAAKPPASTMAVAILKITRFGRVSAADAAARTMNRPARTFHFAWRSISAPIPRLAAIAQR